MSGGYVGLVECNLGGSGAIGLIGGQGGLVVGQGGLGLGETGVECSGVNGGQCLPGGDTLAGSGRDGGDRARDGEVQISRAGRLDACGRDRLGDGAGGYCLDRGSGGNACLSGGRALSQLPDPNSGPGQDHHYGAYLQQTLLATVGATLLAVLWFHVCPVIGWPYVLHVFGGAVYHFLLAG